MTEVIVVTTRSCPLCEDALRGLAELAAEFPIQVRVVSLEPYEGAAPFEMAA
jgi:glutaredoxin